MNFRLVNANLRRRINQNSSERAVRGLPRGWSEGLSPTMECMSGTGSARSANLRVSAPLIQTGIVILEDTS